MKSRKKNSTPVNPREFADVLTGIGGHRGWIGAALGSRLKRSKNRRVPSKQTKERVKAVAELAQKLKSPMSQMSKSERKLSKGGFASLLKSVGITDSAEIEFIRDSNTPESAAMKILSRRHGWKLRTLQNTVSREKAPKA